jgi:hypothetical protein
MEQHNESQDAAIARAVAEEENTLATASTIELARRLAERHAIVYQEIVIEEGQRNIAQAQAQQTRTDAAPAAAPGTPQEEPLPPHCLICDRADRLSEIDDVGHLCFSCLQHNSGAELEGLVFS